MKNTSIEWCDHTWNPWRGCTRVERALDCVNCYAATMGHRFGIEWGPHGIRVQKGEAGWSEPFRWAKKPLIHSCGKAFAEPTLHAPEYAQGMVGAGECCGQYRRARVFALSMGDWLEDEPRTWTHGGQPQGGIPAAWLARMLDTIRLTPTLNWILLTKRPEAFEYRMQDVELYAEVSGNHELLYWLSRWVHGTPPKNVCVMTSVGYQKAADDRIPHLLRIPARWHGLSLEPLLGRVDFLKSSNSWPSDSTHPWMNAPLLTGIDWLIPGGESGHGARPCNVQWIRDIRDQGEIAGCSVFVKQLGSNAVEDAGLSDGFVRFAGLKHPKGGDPAEWPEDLRVRQFPEGL